MSHSFFEPKRILGTVLLSASVTFAGPALAETDRTVPAVDHHTLVVVSSQAEDAPVLGRLPFENLSAADLATAHGKSGHPLREAHYLREAVAASAGVFADLSLVTADQVESDPVLAAALDVGVPIVLVGAADGRGISKLTGLGLGTVGDNAVLVIQAVSSNRFVIYEVGGRIEIEAGDLETLIYDEHTGNPRIEKRANLLPLSQTLEPDAETTAAKVAALLADHELLRTVASAAENDFSRAAEKANPVTNESTLTCYPHMCTQWTVVIDQVAPVLEGTTSQQPVLDVDLHFQLTDSEPPATEGKILTIYSSGSFEAAQNAGSMERNNNQDRGFYQEATLIEVEVEDYFNGQDSYPVFTPSSPVDLGTALPNDTVESAPISIDQSLLLGWTDEPEGGTYIDNYSLSTTTPGFAVSHDIYGNALFDGSSWLYTMTRHAQGPYGTWTDLIARGASCNQDDSLHGVPAIAQESLSPLVYQQYRNNNNFRDSVGFRVDVQQLLRRTWRSLDRTDCQADDYSTRTYLNRLVRSVWIDFGSVSL